MIEALKLFTELHQDAMSFSNFGAASSSTAVTAVPDKDIEVADPPTDSVSALAFSPQAEFLAAGSWDNNVSYFRTVLFVVLMSSLRV